MIFRLNDFFHLPQLEPWLKQLTKIQPGMILIAGMDQRPGVGKPDSILPSGRGAIFHVLLDEILENHPTVRGTIIAHDRKNFRFPREIARKFAFSEANRLQAYSEHLNAASRSRNKLLIVDRLTMEAIPDALDAARRKRLLTQLDTIFWGTGILRHFLDSGISVEQLAGVDWIVTVQRMPTLCSNCKQPNAPTHEQIEKLQFLLPSLEAAGFFHAQGCSHCNGTGRKGDISVFDLFQFDHTASNPLTTPSKISMQQYALHLAARGQLAIEDGLDFETQQLQRAFVMITSTERNQLETKTTLERKLLELETANRVLQQRTQELISLENIGQVLLSSTDLHALAATVCQKALDLCNGNRAILYYFRPDGKAQVLSIGGWESSRVQRIIDPLEIIEANPTLETIPYSKYPPGIPPRHPDLEGALLRTGVAVPLIAQDEQVGLMIVHSTKKNKFSPGDIALLQSFANHAALAIQRAGLVEELRAKITALEAAQEELAIKERLEHELELARKVQENVLPRTFPQIEGYEFTAHYAPARFVGGDFYDVIELGDGLIGLAIADVSDKGMPAALYMTLTRSLLRAEAYRDHSPRAVLARVNQLLMELGEPTAFVTMFYGALDTTTRELVYARAGHDRPILVRGSCSPKELAGHGTPLGFLSPPIFHLTEESIRLERGDRLVLFTDGLTDVCMANGKISDHAFFHTLLGSFDKEAPKEMCKLIFNHLSELQGNSEQFDDMALLIVGVT
ncbi:MAG TPA: SpoIIE family protein phosphatase [Anaerolineales bacterium]|nr:SpoIIE family protein phosphatase [Anaerolineales bacterium]